MNSKPDKKCDTCYDIVFLSEIFRHLQHFFKLVAMIMGQALLVLVKRRPNEEF